MFYINYSFQINKGEEKFRRNYVRRRKGSIIMEINYTIRRNIYEGEERDQGRKKEINYRINSTYLFVI